MQGNDGARAFLMFGSKITEGCVCVCVCVCVCACACACKCAAFSRKSVPSLFKFALPCWIKGVLGGGWERKEVELMVWEVLLIMQAFEGCKLSPWS